MVGRAPVAAVAEAETTTDATGPIQGGVATDKKAVTTTVVKAETEKDAVADVVAAAGVVEEKAAERLAQLSQTPRMRAQNNGRVRKEQPVRRGTEAVVDAVVAVAVAVEKAVSAELHKKAAKRAKPRPVKRLLRRSRVAGLEKVAVRVEIGELARPALLRKLRQQNPSQRRRQPRLEQERAHRQVQRLPLNRSQRRGLWYLRPLLLSQR